MVKKGTGELEDRVLRQQVSRATEKTNHRKNGDSADSPVLVGRSQDWHRRSGMPSGHYGCVV